MLPLEGSLKGIRDALFSRLDLAPNSSSTQVEAANLLINQALQQIALEVPHSMHEETIRVATMRPLSSFNATDTVSLYLETSGGGESVDLWMLQRDLNAQDLELDQVWPTDRSLDGAIIELETADGLKFTNQIRSVWATTVGDVTSQYITLFRPIMPHAFAESAGPLLELGGELSVDTVGPLKYRIYRPHVWLPDYVVEVKSIRRVGEALAPIRYLDQNTADVAGVSDYSFEDGGGTPTYYFRGGNFSLPSPVIAPVLSAHGSLKWTGNFPYVSFEACYTWCLGKRDPLTEVATGRPTSRTEYSATAVDLSFPDSVYTAVENYQELRADFYGVNRIVEPLFESAPSPVSDVYTLVDPGTSAQAAAVDISVPNIEYQLGFLSNGYRDLSAPFGSTFSRLSDAHSGMYCRIYVRPTVASFGTGYANLGNTKAGISVTGLTSIHTDSAFRLLAEFKVTTTNGAKFLWDGQIIPDFQRRLRDVHSYHSLALYPVPDARYELELRILKRPELLVNDTDRAAIDPVACKAVVDLAASLMCERMKDYVGADRNLKRYNEAVSVIQRRYGDMQPAGQPARRIPPNLRGWARPVKWWRTT